MRTVIVFSSKSQFRSLVVVLSCRVRLRIRCAQLLDHPPASARDRMIAAGGAKPRSDRRLPNGGVHPSGCGRGDRLGCRRCRHGARAAAASFGLDFVALGEGSTIARCGTPAPMIRRWPPWMPPPAPPHIRQAIAPRLKPLARATVSSVDSLNVRCDKEDRATHRRGRMMATNGGIETFLRNIQGSGRRQRGDLRRRRTLDSGGLRRLAQAAQDGGRGHRPRYPEGIQPRRRRPVLLQRAQPRRHQPDPSGGVYPGRRRQPPATRSWPGCRSSPTGPPTTTG